MTVTGPGAWTSSCLAGVPVTVGIRWIWKSLWVRRTSSRVEPDPDRVSHGYYNDWHSVFVSLKSRYEFSPIPTGAGSIWSEPDDHWAAAPGATGCCGLVNLFMFQNSAIKYLPLELWTSIMSENYEKVYNVFLSYMLQMMHNFKHINFLVFRDCPEIELFSTRFARLELEPWVMPTLFGEGNFWWRS